MGINVSPSSLKSRGWFLGSLSLLGSGAGLYVAVAQPRPKPFTTASCISRPGYGSSCSVSTWGRTWIAPFEVSRTRELLIGGPIVQPLPVLSAVTPPELYGTSKAADGSSTHLPLLSLTALYLLESLRLGPTPQPDLPSGLSAMKRISP